MRQKLRFVTAGILAAVILLAAVPAASFTYDDLEVAVVRSQWHIPVLNRLPRRIIVIRRTRCKRRRAADGEDGGYHPKSCSFHILVFLL